MQQPCGCPEDIYRDGEEEGTPIFHSLRHELYHIKPPTKVAPKVLEGKKMKVIEGEVTSNGNKNS
jgi:hypothetical protein